MREYEIIFIAHPDQDENATNELVEKISGWISDNGGTIKKVDPWGKRKLAYPIRKQSEGQYFYINAQMPPSFVAELDRNLRYQENVLRYLITLVD